jgi:hypothetical protein
MIKTPPPELSAPEVLRRKRARILWAAVFAAVGIGVCLWSWRHYREVYTTAEPQIPVMDLIPVIPKAQQEAAMNAIVGAARLALALSPEQQEKVRAIWKEPPTSFQEMIAKQKEMDKVLTPIQLAIARPVRKAVQDKIVDEMFESGRDRFTPEDFKKFKDEIKRRVDERMSSP